MNYRREVVYIFSMIREDRRFMLEKRESKPFGKK